MLRWLRTLCCMGATVDLSGGRQRSAACSHREDQKKRSRRRSRAHTLGTDLAAATLALARRWSP